VSVLLPLVVLWLVRPLFHGLVMFFWTSPIVWLPPLTVIAIGALARRRAAGPRPPHPAGRASDPRADAIVRRSGPLRETVERLGRGQRPQGGTSAVFGLAVLALIAGAILKTPLTERSIYTHTRYAQIDGLPAGGKVRLVPRDVAPQLASSGFNSPTERLTDFHIVKTPQGLAWTALRTPNTALRALTKNTAGMLTLDAEQTERDVVATDARFETAPGMQITDNLRWRLLKRHYLIELTDPVAIRDAGGRPLIMVPYLKYTGFLIRRPKLGGVFAVHPDGRIEDLSPERARARPEIAQSGRLFPDTLARRIQDAYAYKRGIANHWFTHDEQTQITDTETNQQPYLIDFGARGAQWVTVAEPFGRAFAVNAVFLTDAITGATRIWRVPKGQSLSGNRRVIQTVRSVSIPGIVFSGSDVTAGTGGGRFRVVEPRPVFVAGRLVFLLSIIPESANSVTKTVIVDAARNKVVAIFNNDTDQNAEAKTIAYLASGAIPAEASPSGQTTGPGGERPATTPQPAAGTGVPRTSKEFRDRLDRLIERQRQLLREAKRLREALK